MRERFLLLCVVFFLFPGALPCAALAGSPMEQVSRTTDKILEILTDPELKDESRTQERRALIRKAVDERFDWEELSRRALGSPLGTANRGGKESFCDPFRRTPGKDLSRQGGGILGRGDFLCRGNGGRGVATVNARVLTAQKTEIPVFYRMRRKGDEWMVYDMLSKA
jgi:phospholipid transport system substrate-binding protein